MRRFVQLIALVNPASSEWVLVRVVRSDPKVNVYHSMICVHPNAPVPLDFVLVLVRPCLLELVIPDDT